MAYNINNVSTAGKVSVFACIIGLLSIAFIFTINISNGTLNHVEAQSVATTTVTVLNTPPNWTVDAQEAPGSSTTTPTNAGDVQSWTAIGTDSNSENYYLLLCKTNATPTPASTGPTCDITTNQWAVSTSTVSGTQATAATTTTASMVEVNAWFAWICDNNATNPRCNATLKQGTGTTSSPFEVNHRPTFTVYSNNSPKLPGQLVTFNATATDSDVSGTADTVALIVCNLNDFSTTTRLCGPGGMIASSTLSASNPSASYTITIPTQDQNYTAFGFVTDNHGFAASGGSEGTNAPITVSNATPTVSSSTISINGGSNMTLTLASGQTQNFALQFTSVDNNSCLTSTSSQEMIGYQASLYRSGIGSTTCPAGGGSFNANNCYTSTVATTTWNLSCTASSTSCTGASDTDVIWNCTFPLWYVADPTDGNATSTQYSAQNWLASIKVNDDNHATSSQSEGSIGVEVVSFLAFSLNTLSIPYGSLQPGQQTDPIVATTTVAATGNVGVNEKLSGQSMCINYATGNPCPTSATSTIAENNQVFGTSTVTYAQGVPLSSSTQALLQVNVPKSTATSTNATGNTFWGIAVPGTITLAGNYKGENTFVAVVSTSTFW